MAVESGMTWTMLLLRLLVAVVLLCHATQKSLGWLGGKGLTGQAAIFEALGMRPGRPMVLLASMTEAVAAVSIGAGLLLPLGVAAGAATMLVAGATMHAAARSAWNARGGGEYPYFIAAVIASLGFAGAGRWSADAVLQRWLPGAGMVSGGFLPGLGAIVLAAAGAVPFVLVLRRSQLSDRRSAEGVTPNRVR